MTHGTGPEDLSRADRHRSSEWELAARQLRAIAAFHHARAIAAWAAAAGERSREMREQDARRLEVLRRKHEAVIGRAHEQLRLSGVRRPTPATGSRIVLAGPRAHDGCGSTLEEHGLHVVARVDNGADAVGIAVVEQPDVVVVGDPLAMVATDEVVRDVRRYSPDTTVVAVATTHERARACADAGATLVLTGEVPAGELVGRLLRLVEQRSAPRR